MKKQIEKAAEDQAVFCHCAGPTCSGCEETSKKLFISGANFVLDRAKILEEALEEDRRKKSHLVTNTLVVVVFFVILTRQQNPR